MSAIEDAVAAVIDNMEFFEEQYGYGYGGEAYTYASQIYGSLLAPEFVSELRKLGYQIVEIPREDN